MVSARGLVLRAPNTRDLLFSDGSDRPLSAQIFGSDPTVMAEAARICQDQGVDLVDINMGCPVPKVVRKGAGAALLRDLQGAARIMEAVRKALKIPLTIKIRSGWTAAQVVIQPLAALARECGVDAITLHARARSQGYGTPADWGLIGALVAAASPVPIIGNGDVLAPQDAKALMDRTGCRAVMIGRAARGNPWIFSAALAHLRGDPAPGLPAPQEIGEMVRDHLARIRMHYRPPKALHVAKAHLLRYARGERCAARFRDRLCKAGDLDALERLAAAFLDSLPWEAPRGGESDIPEIP
jgi:nifR3 family TIM-barrel protein